MPVQHDIVAETELWAVYAESAFREDASVTARVPTRSDDFISPEGLTEGTGGLQQLSSRPCNAILGPC